MSQLYPFTDPFVAVDVPPRAMVSGRGCYVTDADGNEFFDAVAGLWCASLGFSEIRLIEAADRQMRELPYYHGFMGRTARTTELLADKLAAILPDGLRHVFFANSGSEAVDTAVKLTWFYQNARGQPGKKMVIARQGAYHGSGFASGGLTSMAYCHDGFDLPGSFVLRTGSPHFSGEALPRETELEFSQRRARELDELICDTRPERVGAFIGEPVIGSGGVIPPPAGYWPAIQAVLRRHDVLMIADEIITGFGRTGSWFGCDTYGIEPDMLTIAKQLSGAYFPISGLAVADGVYATVAAHAHDLGTFGHGFTSGGHPVGAAVALEAIRIYEEMDVLAVVQQRSRHLAASLETISTMDGVTEVRLVGLMAGVELTHGRRDGLAGLDLARAVGDEAERRGVLFRVIGNTIAISPPLIITDAEIDDIIGVLEASISEVISADRMGLRSQEGRTT